MGRVLSCGCCGRLPGQDLQLTHLRHFAKQNKKKLTDVSKVVTEGEEEELGERSRSVLVKGSGVLVVSEQ